MSEEDTRLAQLSLPVAAPPSVTSFRPKNDSDLFGLGLEETAPKDSSDEGGLFPGAGCWPWGLQHRDYTAPPGFAKCRPRPIICSMAIRLSRARASRLVAPGEVLPPTLGSQ